MDEKRALDMAHLRRKLQIDDMDIELLSRALTHPSYAMEHPGDMHYQRLEFLGDAVVDLIMGEYLFKEFPEHDEGTLTKMRAGLVCEKALANAATRFQLGQWIRFGRGEVADGGAKRTSNLSDAFEALCGAIYLTKGLEPVRTLLLQHLKEDIEMIAAGYYGDYKTRLQEWIQQTPGRQVAYAVRSEEGPAHAKRFHVDVLIDGKAKADGWGKTKKEAERQAALAYLKQVGVIHDAIT